MEEKIREAKIRRRGEKSSEEKRQISTYRINKEGTGNNIREYKTIQHMAISKIRQVNRREAQRTTRKRISKTKKKRE